MDTAPEEFEGQSRALVVTDSVRGLSRPDTPAEMIGLASQMATALKDIVERQRLYTVIKGKKFPQVEAWMTIGRMDNVVAREVLGAVVRHEDGSYEATVELVRLSDGMVVGRASGLCGTADDPPWPTRSEPARRSMAVTRATSRAFRQQYSWIMALAGYEPTPSEEMPRDGATQSDGAYLDTAETAPPVTISGETEELLGVLTKAGTVKPGAAMGYKLEARQTPDGQALGFRLEVDNDRAIPQVLIEGQLASDVIDATGGNPASLAGTWAKVRGRLFHVSVPGRSSYYRLRVQAIETKDWKLPAEAPPAPAVFTPDIEAELDAAVPA